MVQAIPLAIAIGGSIVKGLGANAAHKANARALDAQGMAELNAGVAREAAIREDARRAMGAQIAAQADSGFEVNQGSALDALRESQINATLDALTARREAADRKRALDVRAGQERRAGTAALIGAGFDAVTTALAQKSDWASARAGTSGRA